MGTLVVSLGGRPVESYLRLVGTNGSLHADYVRGTVQRSIGPGSSGIDKALQPYRIARQLLGGTTAALGRRILRRQKSYPGLLEIFEAFYGAIRRGESSPLSSQSILETVRVCQEIGDALDPNGRVETPSSGPDKLKRHGGAPRVLVTGGTGFLGREVVSALRRNGARVRVLARRLPPPWERLPDVDYAIADLGEGLSSQPLEDVHSIVHCAAETSGGWDAHERNSVVATEHLLRAAAGAGVVRVIHISSIAVLSGPGPLNEQTPLVKGRTAGPYVWGKAESERRARGLADELSIDLRIVRPGAIVDWRNFEAPGRLGKRLGNLFVAVGSRHEALGAVRVTDTARILAEMALSAEDKPKLVNLIDPELPSKKAMVEHLRRSNPDLRVLWIPRLLFHPLAWCATFAQRALRPSRSPINIAEIFAHRDYNTTLITKLWERNS